MLAHQHSVAFHMTRCLNHPELASVSLAGEGLAVPKRTSVPLGQGGDKMVAHELLPKPGLRKSLGEMLLAQQAFGMSEGSYKQGGMGLRMYAAEGDMDLRMSRKKYKGHLSVDEVRVGYKVREKKHVVTEGSGGGELGLELLAAGAGC